MIVNPKKNESPEEEAQRAYHNEIIQGKIQAIYNGQKDLMMVNFEQDDPTPEDFAQLETLSFFNLDLTEADMDRIFTNLPGTNIRGLNFSQATFSGPAFREMCNRLLPSPIVDLDISCTNLEPEDYAFLAKKLRGCRLRGLDICGNHTLTVEVLEKLLESLSPLYIEALNLGDCDLTQEETIRLAPKLAVLPLQSLEIYGNRIGNAGFKSLLTLFTSDHPLRYLDVSNCLISAPVFVDEEVLQYFRKTNLEELDLSESSFPVEHSPEDLEQLFACFSQSRLRKLSLFHCDLADEQLSPCLPYFPSLKLVELKIDSNPFTEEGYQTLARGIKRSTITTCEGLEKVPLVQQAVLENRLRIANQRLAAFQLYRNARCTHGHATEEYSIDLKEISPQNAYPDPGSLAELNYAGGILFSKALPLDVAYQVIDKLPVEEELLTAFKKLSIGKKS